MVLLLSREVPPLTPTLSPSMEPMGRGGESRSRAILSPCLQGERWVGMVLLLSREESPLSPSMGRGGESRAILSPPLQGEGWVGMVLLWRPRSWRWQYFVYFS